MRADYWWLKAMKKSGDIKVVRNMKNAAEAEKQWEGIEPGDVVEVFTKKKHVLGVHMKNGLLCDYCVFHSGTGYQTCTKFVGAGNCHSVALLEEIHEEDRKVPKSN